VASLLLPAIVIDRVRSLLSGMAGQSAKIDTIEPAASGWSAIPGESAWLARVQFTSRSASGSVIAKTRRPADHWRSGDTTTRERVSLELLTEWGCGVGPRLLGVDDQLHVILLEDLGSGPAVEDLLVDRDRSAAIGALHDHARTLATLQSASLGHADVFYQRLEANGLARAQDRGVVQIMPFSQRWQGLRAIVDARPYLPSPARAERDIERILNWLENPGPFLTLSNGDFMPQNSRLVRGGVRLLDFEDALYQHALLDAAHLRIPYAAAPCWSQLPLAEAAGLETTYRAALADACPAITDDQLYDEGMAMAVSAWAINRLTRLPKLEQQDVPHPMGYSRRGQQLDLLQSASTSCAAARVLPDLRAWLDEAIIRLRRLWPEVAPRQPDYPALRG